MINNTKRLLYKFNTVIEYSLYYILCMLYTQYNNYYSVFIYNPLLIQTSSSTINY